MTMLTEFESIVEAGGILDTAALERVSACPDLALVGALAEGARKKRHGNAVTFCRVCEWNGEGAAPDCRDAGEIRLKTTPASPEAAREIVRETARFAAGVPLTGFCLGALTTLVGGDHLALAELARALKAEGLLGVAEVPLDVLGDAEHVIEVIRAAQHGGLEARRATVSRASFAERLQLIARAETVQRETGAFKAFAPLPRLDSAEQPSTGYDDVRTIALARLGTTISSIQVDWPLYGPKLAQVAVAFGADDIDGVSVVEPADAGRRRSPREEIARHIRMAFAEPVERDGLFRARP